MRSSHDLPDDQYQHSDSRLLVALLAGGVLALSCLAGAGFLAYSLAKSAFSEPERDAVAAETHRETEPLSVEVPPVVVADGVSVSEPAAIAIEPRKRTAAEVQVPVSDSNAPVSVSSSAEQLETATPVGQSLASQSAELASTSAPVAAAGHSSGDVPSNASSTNDESTNGAAADGAAADGAAETAESPPSTPAPAANQLAQAPESDGARVTELPVVKKSPGNETIGKSSKQGEPLSYVWRRGDIHSYTVAMTAGLDGDQYSVSGTVALTIDETRPTDQAASPDELKPVTGSGTGFAVSADGVLVTCAHVVQGADSIDVKLGGKSYPARVISVVPDDDLALLKIEATGLTALKLADSAKVRTGESIRAIGFPLSDLLGEGVKVTSGSVAGVVDRAGSKRFQIDAAINPGNSGGPVVNARGEVIGVASSKLTGVEVSRVGFCVPVERVTELLDLKKVSASGSASATDLDGPELVEAVAPAVALIKVTIDPQKASGELVQIKTSGSFNTARGGSDRLRPFFSFPSTTFDSGSLVVDAFGHRAGFDSPNQLPFLAGPMALLTVHSLDQAGRESWTVRERIKISIQQSDPRFGPRSPRPRLPFGPRGFDPFAPKTLREFEAVEEHQYRIKSDSDDRVVVEKTFSLTTLDDDTAPYFRITGTGDIVFSRASGLVESFEFAHHYEKNDGTDRVEIPLKIVVKREEPAVVARRQRESAIRLAESEQTRAAETASAAAAENAKSPDDRLNEVLAKLKDTGKPGYRAASILDELAKLPVIAERQAEVESLLLEQLESSDQFIVKSASETLQKWGMERSVGPLTTKLSDKSFVVVQAACKALGGLGNAEAVVPIIETMRTNRLARFDGQKALAAIGNASEGPVIALLGDPDQQLFQMACDTLAIVGSDDAIGALESLAQGSDRFRKTFAQRALSSVRKRVEAAKTAADNRTVSESVNTPPEHAARIDAVIAAIADKSVSDADRASTIERLADASREYRHDELEDALALGATNAYFPVAHKSMLALASRGSVRVVPAVIRMLHAEEIRMWPQALQIIERVATPEHVDQLVDLVAHPGFGGNLIQVVKKVGVSPLGEASLLNESANTDAGTRRALLDLIGEIGSPASLPQLDDLALAETPTTAQFAAARAAARIRLRNK